MQLENPSPSTPQCADIPHRLMDAAPVCTCPRHEAQSNPTLEGLSNCAEPMLTHSPAFVATAGVGASCTISWTMSGRQ
jgi:hypothetical protein